MPGGGEPAQFITNGTFDGGSACWTVGPGWSIVGGIAEQSGFADALSQEFGGLTVPLISGNDYTLTLDVLVRVGGAVRVALSGDGSQTLYESAATGLAISTAFTANGNHTTLIILSPGEVAIAVDNIRVVPA